MARKNICSVQVCRLQHRCSTDGVWTFADCVTDVQQMECAGLQIAAPRFNRWSVQVCKLQHRGATGEWQRSPSPLHALRVEGPRRRGPKQTTNVTMMTAVMTVNGDQRRWSEEEMAISVASVWLVVQTAESPLCCVSQGKGFTM